MSNRKDMIIHSIVGLKKQTLYKNDSIEKTIPDVSNKTCITEVENKIHNANSSVKKKNKL